MTTDFSKAFGDYQHWIVLIVPFPFLAGSPAIKKNLSKYGPDWEHRLLIERLLATTTCCVVS